jgi:hypothetical protein
MHAIRFPARIFRHSEENHANMWEDEDVFEDNLTRFAQIQVIKQSDAASSKSSQQ